MDRKRTGFGTSSGFELAAIGSAVGLGNIWGFPYKTSANGGAAYLFVYLLCILLVGAAAMLAEFGVGRRGRANPVTAYKSFSPNWGAVGLLSVVIPALIICYYYVLGGYTVKYALSSFAGNIGIFTSFAANTGDVLLHTVIFAALAFSIIAAGVRRGIEASSKILLPSMMLLLLVICCFTFSLGEGVRDGLVFYLRPDFHAISRAGVLSAMGQAFFSLSLGCGAMITYGSYTGKNVNLFRSTAMICILDAVITFMVGLAIFPALFHYVAVSGTSASELGMGGIGLVFLTLPLVFGEMPMIGQLVSLLFFTMTAIAALTSVVSIVEVVTQFIIQCHRIYRTRAAATTYELGIGELLPSVSLVLFSVLFFALILALSIRESSVIDIIGKFLTPALLLGLAVMILVGRFHPIGQVSDTVQVESVLETGIEAGYQTLDVLAALVFGAVLVKSADEKGYHEEKFRLKVLVGASVVAGVLLLLVYLGLAWLGASASEVYPPEISRASLVISIVQRLLGRPGLVLFSVVVALACITTAVGLVSSTADHFATISGRKLSYRLCVIVICVFSALVSNLGLDTIISVAAPILGLVYPPVLVLVAVSLVMPHMSNSICISAVLGALLMSVLSTADSLGLAMPWLHRMPLANVDMAWILPSVFCGVAAFLYRLPWLERAED